MAVSYNKPSVARSEKWFLEKTGLSHPRCVSRWTCLSSGSKKGQALCFWKLQSARLLKINWLPTHFIKFKHTVLELLVNDYINKILNIKQFQCMLTPYADIIQMLDSKLNLKSKFDDSNFEDSMVKRWQDVEGAPLLLVATSDGLLRFFRLACTDKPLDGVLMEPQPLQRLSPALLSALQSLS